MSDSDNNPSHSQTEPTEEMERMEIIESLKQILEDISGNETKYSILQHLEEDFGTVSFIYVDNLYIVFTSIKRI